MLVRQEEELRKKMAALSEEGRQLAEQAGTASDSIFDLRRQGLEKSIADARQRVEDLDLQIFDLEQQARGSWTQGRCPKTWPVSEND